MTRPRFPIAKVVPLSASVLSAGIIPVRRVLGVTEVLLLRCYRYWDFPKGVVNKREEPLAAAIRELDEETGLRRVSFPWGTSYRETPPYARGKVARYYIGSVEDTGVVIRPNPVLGIVEHHEFRWLAWDDARKLLAGRVRPILDWARMSVEGAVASGSVA